MPDGQPAPHGAPVEPGANHAGPAPTKASVAQRSPYYAIAPRLPEVPRIQPAELLREPVSSVELEVGPGRGNFLFERAQACGGVGLIGFEIRLKWAARVDERLRREGLGGRCRVFAADAREALPRLHPGALQRVYFHFPDPWWKKRHAKRRLCNRELLRLCVTALRPGGELFMQSDVVECVEAYRAELDGLAGLRPQGDAPGNPRLACNPYGARSPRERRAVESGLPIGRLRYQRVEL